MNLDEYGSVKTNYNLVNDNTFKIAARCDYFIIVNNIIKLTNLIQYLNEEKIKYLILGGGANLIFPMHYAGIVIKLDFKELKIKKNKIEVGASYLLGKLAMETVNLNLAGLEWAAGLPGTIGGAIIGNAGANAINNLGIMTYVDQIEVLENNKIKILHKNDIEYGYRHTNLKTKNVIVLKIYLTLNPGNKEDLLAIIKTNNEKRKASQPLEYPSAGSVFRNPEGVAAGKLIDDLGLKGYQIGGAKISEKHANFIINVGGATSDDVIKLINYVHSEVKNKYDLDLTVEQQIID